MMLWAQNLWPGSAVALEMFLATLLAFHFTPTLWAGHSFKLAQLRGLRACFLQEAKE